MGLIILDNMTNPSTWLTGTGKSQREFLLEVVQR
jgi:hypothetical protein